MRRKDRELSREAALAVFDAAPFATLSMTDGGRPYAVPVSPAREGMTVYFHCAPEGRKLGCLRANPAVCLSAVSEAAAAPDKFTMYYASAVAFGEAHEVTDEAEKLAALRLICERFTPGNMADFERAAGAGAPRTAVWRVELSEITGKHKVRK